MNTTSSSSSSSTAITKESLQNQLTFESPDKALAIDNVSPELQQQTDEIVSKIMSIDLKDLTARESQARAVQNLGQPIQAELARQSQMLKAPMTTLMKDAEDGGQVAQDLLSLQEQVNAINPNRVDFTMSTVRRLLAKLPGFGTPMARWFAQYQAVDSVITDIMKSLKDGKAQLERDSSILRTDQQRMRELTFKLQDYIKMGQLLDHKLTQSVNGIASGDPQRQFLEEELLFPLRQRIIDLQQQLAVNQQGVLATEVIIRNNKELIIGVDRALNVTVTALNTAATLQIALQRQKKVLKGVQAVTDTTNDLIAGTAEQLKTQSTEIQKQAAQATLDIDMLKKAFLDVEATLQDLSQFRRDALPNMAQSIVELDQLSGKMNDAIEKMEGGNAVSAEYALEIRD